MTVGILGGVEPMRGEVRTIENGRQCKRVVAATMQFGIAGAGIDHFFLLKCCARLFAIGTVPYKFRRLGKETN
jgi:hypothetical protein